ncbi:MAG TPA: M66 family metalloprotease [Polyangiaceae bacterium]|jgi:hypothetical protein
MKRIVVVALVAACSGGGSSGDPTALDQPLSQSLAISEIALLQAVKTPIMQNQAAADHSGIPIVALKDSVLRVYVQPQSDYQPHEITARARIVTSSPLGTTAQVFSATATIDRTTEEGDLTTSFNIPIPGIALEPGSSVTVVLNDADGDPPDIASSVARWPNDGSTQDLGVRSGGDHLRVEIVPVQYDADGSHRLPDTSDAQIESYRERFAQLYPAAEVDITVHDPWPSNVVLDAGGNGTLPLLQALQELRSNDQPDADVYYYAAFEPTASFASYCGGGCVTGLSFTGAPLSVGIGYTDSATFDTAAHEVGHAHGLNHAPCGGASAVDPNFPYKTGSIGVWGYDALGQTMMDPAKYKDIMSYCDPKWISDYDYNLIFDRVRGDNGYANDWVRRGGARYQVAPVTASGEVRVSSVALREPWIARGEPREVSWGGRTSTAFFFPYDHADGGALYVPDEVPNGARVIGLRPNEAAATLIR